MAACKRERGALTIYLRATTENLASHCGTLEAFHLARFLHSLLFSCRVLVCAFADPISCVSLL